MPLNVGDRLGHYEVTALIGEGGKGQVYRATDTKLNRQVALKVLPQAFTGDPDRLARLSARPRSSPVSTIPTIPGVSLQQGVAFLAPLRERLEFWALTKPARLCCRARLPRSSTGRSRWRSCVHDSGSWPESR